MHFTNLLNTVLLASQHIKSQAPFVLYTGMALNVQIILHIQACSDLSLLTHLCLASHKGTLANSVDPDQTLQNAASDQGLHCLH